MHSNPPKGNPLDLDRIHLNPPFAQVRSKDPDVTARINALPQPVKRAAKKLQAACGERSELWGYKEKPETFKEICKAAGWKPALLKYVPHKLRNKPGPQKKSAKRVARISRIGFIRERVDKMKGKISAKQLHVDSVERHKRDIFEGWKASTLDTRLSEVKRTYRQKMKK